MAAFGRSISSSRAKKATAAPAHDFSVKSVPRKARNPTASSDEVCAREPESFPGVPSSVVEEEGEIRLGDVEIQLRELEGSSLTSENSSGESTTEKIKAGEGQNLDRVATSRRQTESMCWKYALALLLTVMATIASLVLAIYLTVKLEGIDLGPVPT